MNIPIISQINDALQGIPDHVLTLLLTVISVGILFTAWYASPAVKAAALAWIIIP